MRVVFLAGIELPYRDWNIAPPGKVKRETIKDICAKVTKHAVACLLLALMAVPFVSVSATQAAAETRSLKLYYVHTREKAVITFKRNGKFDQKGLQELNRFLRDWRRNQPTKMDPRLFDLVWEVYRRSGATDYINVVSAFRSPETNGMLRSRTQGVAKNSQHTLGKAMDFYIPGVKLSRLREVAMQLQVGGVGFYPTSGSPFVHLDVGNVRAWPRMNREDLVRIFPNGKTVHLPADGKPLPGYEQALADYKRRVSSSSIEIASTAGAGPSSSGGKKRTLFSALFGGGDEEEDADSIASPAPATRPSAPAVAAAQPVVVAAVAPTPPAPEANINAPLPLARPAFRNQDADNGLATALYSPTRSAAQDALRAAMPATPVPTPAPGETFADLAQYNIPVPTLLGPRGMRGDAQQDILTASVDPRDLPVGANSAVPVPVHRPVVAEALLAAAHIDPEAAGDEAAQSDAVLSPVVVAALEQSGQNARAALRPAIPAERQMQVASLAPAASARQKGEFGDAFDVKPASGNGGLSAGLPAKGGRPKKEEAVISQQALIGGGRLTQDLISDWALNKNKGEAPRSVKAPRVSTRILSHDLTASAASAGFRHGTVAVDSSRFSSPTRMP